MLTTMIYVRRLSFCQCSCLWLASIHSSCCMLSAGREDLLCEDAATQHSKVTLLNRKTHQKRTQVGDVVVVVVVLMLLLLLLWYCFVVFSPLYFSLENDPELGEILCLQPLSCIKGTWRKETSKKLTKTCTHSSFHLINDLMCWKLMFKS